MASTNEKETPKEKSDKQAAKEHLAKFLDVTRSDMLFADKVILVEGIAEKLLLPEFMEKCGCAYEDEHISIVEIGGKHFEHFVKNFCSFFFGRFSIAGAIIISPRILRDK